MMTQDQASSPINLAELEAMIGEDAYDLLADLAEIFIEQAEDQLHELRQAIHDGNTKLVREWSHSMKGSSASIAATQLSAKCASLELDARNGDLTQAQTKFGLIEDEYARVRQALLPHLP